jgi:hypothetical protein
MRIPNRQSLLSARMNRLPGLIGHRKGGVKCDTWDSIGPQPRQKGSFSEKGSPKAAIYPSRPVGGVARLIGRFFRLAGEASRPAGKASRNASEACRPAPQLFLASNSPSK